jgi:hypothetical protein
MISSGEDGILKIFDLQLRLVYLEDKLNAGSISNILCLDNGQRK